MQQGRRSMTKSHWNDGRRLSVEGFGAYLGVKRDAICIRTDRYRLSGRKEKQGR